MPPARTIHRVGRDAAAEIKSRLDIVDVVGGYLSLQRTGRHAFKALCPFHSEKTPSFSVSQDRQAWYCFGCQQGGDIFTFVEKVEHGDFRQALELLAEKAGIELTPSGPSGRGSRARRARLLDVNTRACAFFMHVLWSQPAGEAGRHLLAARGVSRELAERFGIGFAPAGGPGEDALARYLTTRAAVAAEEVVEAGLAHHARRGRLRDRFRHRLVFPIRDERGQVIAFGARALGDAIPKYLNSPETAVYHKSAALYGLDLARASLHSTRIAVVVEGYFDVVAAHAAGVEHVVASSGTALTAEQVRLLKRHVEVVVLCFDADDAGLEAASRAVDVTGAAGLAARIVVLPPGVKDPDEMVRRDPEAFRQAVDQAPPEWQVLLDRSLGGGEGGSISDRRAAAEATVALLARIPEAAVRELYVQQAARRLALSAAALGADVAATVRSGSRRPLRLRAPAPAAPGVAPPGEASAAPPVQLPPPSAWDGYLAALCVHRPALAARLVGEFKLDPSAMSHPVARALVEAALLVPPGQPFPLSGLSVQARDLAAELMVRTIPELLEEASDGDLERVVAECVGLVAETRVRSEIEQVRAGLAVAAERGDQEAMGRLAGQLRELAGVSPRLRRSAGRVLEGPGSKARPP